MRPRLLLLLAAVLVVALAALTLLFWQRTPAARLMPEPNGFNDFEAAAKLVTKLPAATDDWQKLKPAALETWVAANAPALALVRTGLTKQCLAPVVGSLTNLEARMEQLGSLKRLGQALCAESRLAALQGRTKAAASSALDCVRFGQESARGGPVIQSLVGIAVRAIGLAQFNRVSGSLDAATLRQAAATLEKVVATRETAADVLESEALFVRTAFPLGQRLAGRIANWTSGNQAITKGTQKLDAEAQGLARAMLDCACRAYEMDHGKPPASATNLVPDYLQALPNDPVTGQPLPLPRGR
jgi:hypothetical protein